jgi:hypothetical protein
MEVLRKARRSFIWALLALLASLPGAVAGEALSEYQVKAVFLFNFAHFVEWPPTAFGSANQPFVIGVLGDDPFGARLAEVVRGEQISQHPLTVRHLRDLSNVDDCQILYIDRSKDTQLTQILGALQRRSTLTVSDMNDSSQRGVMIQFLTENNRIRLRINVDSARAAGLTISSKLLRPAEIVGTSVE